jgi:hypothetical protein
MRSFRPRVLIQDAWRRLEILVLVLKLAEFARPSEVRDKTLDEQGNEGGKYDESKNLMRRCEVFGLPRLTLAGALRNKARQPTAIYCELMKIPIPNATATMKKKNMLVIMLNTDSGKNPEVVTLNGRRIRTANRKKMAWTVAALSPSLTNRPSKATPERAVTGVGTPPSPVACTMSIVKCP